MAHGSRIRLVVLLVALVATLAYLAVLAHLARNNYEAISNNVVPLLSKREHGIPDGYVPVEITMLAGMSSKVTLCKPDWDAYTAKPYEYSMFKVLVEKCKRDSSTGTAPLLERTIWDLNEELPRLHMPSGFVFHESRVGSTLVANMLKKDPLNLVYSESHPPSVIANAPNLDQDTKIKMLRIVVNAMANSERHSRLFFKFQSVNSRSISLYRKAFPDVPWMFIFRNPVEVMVSNIGDPTLSRNAPCLRRRISPPREIVAFLGEDPPDDAQYCAAHLRSLCEPPLQERSKDEKGVLVKYEDLPQALYEQVLPAHFGYFPDEKVLKQMIEVSDMYSKGHRQPSSHFEGDSLQKQRQADERILNAAKEVLYPAYQRLVSQAETDMVAMKTKLKDPEVLKEHKAYINSFAPISRSRNTANMGLPPGTKFSKEMTVEEYLPYPKLRPLKEVFEEWPPDEPDVPDIPGIAEGTLERFDFQKPDDRERAALLQLHEVPFMLYNVPNINDVVEKWSSDDYLAKRFGNQRLRITTSETNHFMYFNKKQADSATGYRPSTGQELMSFREWLQHAYAAQKQPVDTPHYYLQFNGAGPTRWVADDLSVFKPERSFFIVEPHLNRGINCRFGARGIIAESHYDGGRNFVAMLRGAKRYVLLPPEECQNLYLYPRQHPESRHAQADWSNLDWEKFPLMKNAKAAQVVVRAGEVLYIPSYWFHYIVSTNFSAQCNTRSGHAIRGRDAIADCGFY